MKPNETITWSGHLLFTVTGIKEYPNRPERWNVSAKASKGKPATDPNEVSMAIVVDIPAAVFTRPQFSARFTIPADSVEPVVVSQEVLGKVEEALSRETGFTVKILPVEPT